MRQNGYITRQAKRLSTGEINRRRFVMQALTAGVTMPTAMSLASRAEAAQPRKGGVLRHAVATPDPLDSANFVTGNALTEVVSIGVTGELARRFGASEGNELWTFLLRDVSFHSGKPLDASDVAATFEAFVNRFPSDPLTRMIARIETEGERVTFHLEQPDAAFAERLADPRLVIRPLVRDALEHADGTGPFALVQSDRALYTRFEKYWKPSVPHFDAVEVISLTDAKARQNAILNSDVDIVEGIDPRSVALLQRMPNLEIIERDGETLFGVALSESAHLLVDTLTALLPREELVTKVLLGHGRVAGGAQDLEAAFAHFQRSGHTGPILLGADESTFPGATSTVRLVADAARAIGIDVQITEPSQAHAVATRLSDPDAGLGAIYANAIIAFSDHLAGRDTLQIDPHRLAERGWFL